MAELSYDEALYEHQQHTRLALSHPEFFSHAKLVTEPPEPYTAPPDAELTHNDFPEAEGELRRRYGVSEVTLREMLFRAHQRSGLGYSVPERTRVAQQVMLSLARGRTELGEDQIVALSRPAEYADVDDSDFADPGYQSDGQKRYPVNTAKRVRSAWSYIHQEHNAGQYTAKQLRAIKDKIIAAARKFGVELAGDGDHDEGVQATRRLVRTSTGSYQTTVALSGSEVALAGQTQETRARMPSGSADDIVSRHRDTGFFSGRRPGMATHVHVQDADPADLDYQGKISHYLATGKDPNTRIAPKSPAQRAHEERMARPGHTNGGGWAGSRV
jgi:hypothetical protein